MMRTTNFEDSTGLGGLYTAPQAPMPVASAPAAATMPGGLSALQQQQWLLMQHVQNTPVDQYIPQAVNSGGGIDAWLNSDAGYQAALQGLGDGTTDYAGVEKAKQAVLDRYQGKTDLERAQAAKDLDVQGAQQHIDWAKDHPNGDADFMDNFMSNVFPMVIGGFMGAGALGLLGDLGAAGAGVAGEATAGGAAGLGGEAAGLGTAAGASAGGSSAAGLGLGDLMGGAMQVVPVTAPAAAAGGVGLGTVAAGAGAVGGLGSMLGGGSPTPATPQPQPQPQTPATNEPLPVDPNAPVQTVPVTAPATPTPIPDITAGGAITGGGLGAIANGGTGTEPVATQGGDTQTVTVTPPSTPTPTPTPTIDPAVPVAAGIGGLGAIAGGGTGSEPIGVQGGDTPTVSVTPPPPAPVDPTIPVAAGVGGIGAIAAGGTGSEPIGVQGGDTPVVSVGPPTPTPTGGLGDIIPPVAAGVGLGTMLGGDGGPTASPSPTPAPTTAPVTDPAATSPTPAPTTAPVAGGTGTGGTGIPGVSIPGVIGSVIGGGGTGLGGIGDILAGAAGYHMNQADKDYYQNLMDKMTGMYQPGTPEEELMRKQMEAKDAAAGRNSQYGTRAINLAGMLNQERARVMTSPTYEKLAEASRGHYDSSLNSIFGGLGAAGANGLGSSLMNLLGGGASSAGSLFDLFGGDSSFSGGGYF